MPLSHYSLFISFIHCYLLTPFDPTPTSLMNFCTEMVFPVLLWMKTIRSKIFHRLLSILSKKKNFHRLDNWMRVPIKLLWLHLLKALEIRQIENPFRPIRSGVAEFQMGVSVLYSTYPSRKWKKSLVLSVGKQWKKETFQLLQSEDRKVWGKYYLEPCCKAVTGERKFCVRNFAWLSWSH